MWRPRRDLRKSEKHFSLFFPALKVTCARVFLPNFFRGGREDLQADMFWLWLDRLCDTRTLFTLVLHFAQFLATSNLKTST